MGRALRVGVPGGMIGGLVMAVWSMIAMWITGAGFWTPLNLIAHTFYKSAPLNATFSVPAALIGLAVHMTVASIFGTAIAAIALRLPGRRSVVLAAGILFIAAVWPIMQWIVWYKLDEDAAEGFTDWIFAVAHLMFGLTAAGFAMIGVDDDDYPRRGRHAAPRTMPQLSSVPGSLFLPDRRRQQPPVAWATRHVPLSWATPQLALAWATPLLALSWATPQLALSAATPHLALDSGATGRRGWRRRGRARRPG